jgi:ferritin-like metal-binding protein YciE
MHAFIEETGEKLSNCTDPEIKDACLLASIQAINHFKISMYGTAAAFANALEMDKQACLFHEAEVNEKQIDDRLTQLALYEINNHAKSPVTLPG